MRKVESFDELQPGMRVFVKDCRRCGRDFEGTLRSYPTIPYFTTEHNLQHGGTCVAVVTRTTVADGRCYVLLKTRERK